ncbi:MAG: hypothetical protein KBC73_03345 [Burkholderiaceae bacterium]|nr:hypothetical protein [Burkholderiaceae bacterium]
MTPRRRHLLQSGLAWLPLPVFSQGQTRASAPFRRLAVADPPFEEEYEVIIAMAPPLARGTIAKVLTRAVSEADEQLKTDKLTAALDPAQTRLLEHFVQALAGELADAEARLMLVAMDAEPSEDQLLLQMRRKAPQADALMLVNLMGRFVALHGLAAYAPSLLIGVKALPARGGTPLLDHIFTAGFRGLDPRATHLEVVDMPERFDNMAALLGDIPRARAALQAGAEAIAAEVARRLLAGG